LKEGFATFMEFVMIGYNYPEFKLWLHFVSSKIVSAMARDSMRNSHPIEVPFNFFQFIFIFKGSN